MMVPIFEILAADTSVTALISTRCYPFGQAPQSVQTPYAAWQLLGGAPENYINQRPDVDRYELRVDAYAQTAQQARDVAAVLRDAIEPHAHVIAWLGEVREADTQLYVVAFLVEWFVPR